MRLIGGFAALAVGASLAGCNMVVTETPLFSSADVGDAHPPRPGVWNADKADCAFDETLPQNKWPDCAKATPPLSASDPWLAVGGDPALLQLSMPKESPVIAGLSFYLAYRPLKLDDHGRTTEMAFWAVQCGPPPKGSNPGLTQSLLPGLEPRADKSNCTTTSKEALRDAAKASEAWGQENGKTPRSHWVRDPIAGDLPARDAAPPTG
jgi:hypothetical protein